MAKVRLSEVVARIKDKVNPSELTYYIGGEHFEYGAVTVDKKAAIAGSTIGPAFHIRFKPGDVLLMSRNPHLRKAGMVDFEGLCSDVSYVCRAKDDSVLLQSFLPFIFQSDDFWKFAEANKKGSTNFFLNWSDFEKYEFSLPPLAEQKKLAETLWAMERVKHAYKKLLAETDALAQARFVEMFGDPVKNDKGWPIKGLLDIGYCKNGLNFGPNESGCDLYCVGVGDFKDRNVIDDVSCLSKISVNEKPSDELLLRDGDILFVRSNGNKALVGRSLVINVGDEAVAFSGFCIRFRKTSCDIELAFLANYLRVPVVRRLLQGRGANIQNLNQQTMAQLKIPLPPLALQREFAAFIAQQEKAKASLKESLAALTVAQKALMNSSFAKATDDKRACKDL